MAKCSHCRQRKAKRACPALRDNLCPLCCGRLRNREVACPPGCRHLSEHAAYQDQRTLERKIEPPKDRRPEEGDPLGDERLAWLAVHAEAPLREAAARRPEFGDGDLILALESAKDKLVRDRGRIFIPGADRPAGHEAGEAVVEAMARCRFERSVILEAGTGGYTAEEKILVLDRLIAAAKSTARGEFKGRAYIDRLLASFDKMESGAGGTKLVLPR